MHKRLLLLGLLFERPLTGYEVNRIVAAHGDLYSDLKKSNVYYLLERLAREGLVAVNAEGGARGPRGQRLVYSLTAAGRTELVALLRRELGAYAPPHVGIDIAIMLIDHLPRDEARQLLMTRRRIVDQSVRMLESGLGPAAVVPGSAGDHMLMLAGAERRWLERAIRRLQQTRKGHPDAEGHDTPRESPKPKLQRT